MSALVVGAVLGFCGAGWVIAFAVWAVKGRVERRQPMAFDVEIVRHENPQAWRRS